MPLKHLACRKKTIHFNVSYLNTNISFFRLLHYLAVQKTAYQLRFAFTLQQYILFIIVVDGVVLVVDVSFGVLMALLNFRMFTIN